MRLSSQTQQVIRETAQEIFGLHTVVKLFGSRIDDNARGGDIDLLIESTSIVIDSERKALQLIARLQIRIGDQPIDVLVLDPSRVKTSIIEQASATGIPL